jgi:hypothetical protein
MCNTLSTMYFATGTPGVFRVKDAIGKVKFLIVHINIFIIEVIII